MTPSGFERLVAVGIEATGVSRHEVEQGVRQLLATAVDRGEALVDDLVGRGRGSTADITELVRREVARQSAVVAERIDELDSRLRGLTVPPDSRGTDRSDDVSEGSVAPRPTGHRSESEHSARHSTSEEPERSETSGDSRSKNKNKKKTTTTKQKSAKTKKSDKTKKSPKSDKTKKSGSTKKSEKSRRKKKTKRKAKTTDTPEYAETGDTATGFRTTQSASSTSARSTASERSTSGNSVVSRSTRRRAERDEGAALRAVGSSGVGRVATTRAERDSA